MKTKDNTSQLYEIPQMRTFDFLGGISRHSGDMNSAIVCGNTAYSMQAVRESINHVFGETPPEAQERSNKTV